MLCAVQVRCLLGIDYLTVWQHLSTDFIIILNIVVLQLSPEPAGDEYEVG